MNDDAARAATEALILARLDPAALPIGVPIITTFRRDHLTGAVAIIFTGQKYTFTAQQLQDKHENLHPPKQQPTPKPNR